MSDNIDLKNYYQIPDALAELVDLDSMSDAVRTGVLTYSRYLDDEAIENLKNLDEGDRAYFWAYLVETIPRELDKAILKRMEQGIMRGLSTGAIGLAERNDEAEALPFKYAEGRLRPSAWFGRSYI